MSLRPKRGEGRRTETFRPYPSFGETHRRFGVETGFKNKGFLEGGPSLRGRGDGVGVNRSEGTAEGAVGVRRSGPGVCPKVSRGDRRPVDLPSHPRLCADVRLLPVAVPVVSARPIRGGGSSLWGTGYRLK